MDPFLGANVISVVVQHDGASDIGAIPLPTMEAKSLMWRGDSAIIIEVVVLFAKKILKMTYLKQVLGVSVIGAKDLFVNIFLTNLSSTPMTLMSFPSSY